MPGLVDHRPPQVIIRLSSTDHIIGALDPPDLLIGILEIAQLAPVHPGDPSLGALSVHYEVVLSVVQQNSDVIEKVLDMFDLGLHNIVIESIVNSVVA